MRHCFRLLGAMLWVLCILQLMFNMACGCIAEERIALMRVRASFLEANPAFVESWGQSDDCCSWEGVRCDSNSRVSGLGIDFTFLPPPNTYIEGCSWNMDLTMFSRFHELQRLDLSSSFANLKSFEGLLGLTKLRYLNLAGNCLVGGNILESLGELASLEVIVFESCGISGALHSSTFENLKNLRELHLNYNQLNGSIPASLLELPHLEYLDLSGNLLQGLPTTSPSNLSSSLRELHLQSNQLSGIIPASLFKLPHLEYLDLSENLLQGQIPISSSTNLSLSLKILDLSANNLNGLFDFFWLRNCTMLKKVGLSGNADLAIDVKFRRRVPPFQLRELVLSGCKMDNSIIAGPNFLGTQSHLRILDLSSNNLTGSIPSWINTRYLVYLKLANNSLAGSLNLIWQNQSNLEMIDISMNRFVGQLPSNISFVFPNLTVLNASYNIIFGHLPPSLCKISNLQYVDLSNNKLTGEVPTCLFTDCSTLNVLKLSNNNLGGSILGGVSNLSIGGAIYLASNNFKGTLPHNLSGKIEETCYGA